MKSRLYRWFLRVACAVVLLVGLLGAVLYFYQDRMLWHPRAYRAGQIAGFPRALAPLDFRTAQGKEVAFYVPPRDARPLPASLCVLFAGNGSLALDWGTVVAADATPDRAFLLVDYPGYGLCEGKPSPASIAQNVTGAMDTLARRLGVPDGSALERSLAADGRLEVAGHSMGTGVALAFAASCPEVSRVVLLAPATSLQAMARRQVGWPYCLFLRINFDNLARLDDLAARAVPPRVLILHGDHDALIPPAMGRALAAAHPGFVRYEAVVGANHDVVAQACPRLLAALDER